MSLGLALAFEVGHEEKHFVEFRWSQVLGLARIWVDGREVLRERHNFSLHRTRRYKVTVGDVEIHSVVIEKTRPLWFAGFRRQGCRAFVDGDRVGAG